MEQRTIAESRAGLTIRRNINGPLTTGYERKATLEAWRQCKGQVPMSRARARELAKVLGLTKWKGGCNA